MHCPLCDIQTGTEPHFLEDFCVPFYWMPLFDLSRCCYSNCEDNLYYIERDLDKVLLMCKYVFLNFCHFKHICTLDTLDTLWTSAMEFYKIIGLILIINKM